MTNPFDAVHLFISLQTKKSFAECSESLKMDFLLVIRSSPVNCNACEDVNQRDNNFYLLPIKILSPFFSSSDGLKDRDTRATDLGQGSQL